MSATTLVLLGIYVLVNVFVFFLYGADKRRAQKNRWRISEKTLLIAAAFGVFGAALGMKVFRHKTKHTKFTVGIPVIFVLEAALVAVVMFVL